ADRVPARADARAEERSQVPPGAEVHITVEQERPFGLACRVTIIGRTRRRATACGKCPDIKPMEIRGAPIFAGDVETKPVVDCIADAEAEDRSGIKALVDIVHRSKAR